MSLANGNVFSSTTDGRGDWGLVEFRPSTSGLSWIWHSCLRRYIAGYGYGVLRIHVVYTRKVMMDMMGLRAGIRADYIYAMI